MTNSEYILLRSCFHSNKFAVNGTPKANCWYQYGHV